MYKYEIERNVLDPQIKRLYVNYFPRQSKFMLAQMKNGRCKFFVVAKHEEQIIGAMGIYIEEEVIYRCLNIVVHPDHRSKFVGNSIRYMGIKFCIDEGAKQVGYNKEDNQFTHQRMWRIGYDPVEGIKDRHGQLWYPYLKDIIDLDLVQLEDICKLIKDGKQHLLKEL